MDSMKWSKQLETGVLEMDNEHRAILELMSTLRTALRTTASDGGNRDVVQDVLKEAVSFVRNHFAAEEVLMQQTRYPAYDEHKKEHELFLARIQGMQDGGRGVFPSLTLDTLNVLSNHLHHHVNETDKSLVPYLFKIGLPSSMNAGSSDNQTVETLERLAAMNLRKARERKE